MSGAQGDQPRLVVGVGASAGGLLAFRSLLRGLGEEPPAAYVLVQHLDPSRPSQLVDLLRPHTSLTVVEAVDGMPLEAGHVYVSTPGTEIAVRGGALAVRPLPDGSGQRTVDTLLSSLARELGARSVGVVLSGAGHDGSLGIREVAQAGGLALVQDPLEAEHDSMPRAALRTGAVDAAVAAGELGVYLERFAALAPDVAEPSLASDELASEAELGDDPRARLMQILRPAGIELECYKTATIDRRVRRRMGLAGFEADLHRYLEHLEGDAHERSRLLHDLLIGVTELFRDPEAFEELRQLVILPLVRNAAPGDTVRVWVPACSTGEEAYTIGMLILDAIDASGSDAGLHIFATDLDEEALETARGGRYPAPAAEAVPERYASQFLAPGSGGIVHVAARLRDAISFARHDLCSDPPFARMNLISCRNVLIYLKPSAQAHVLRSLHFALVPDGALFLGSSESVGAEREGFATVSKGARIFQKVGPSRRPPRSGRSRARWSWRQGLPDDETDRAASAGAQLDASSRAVLELAPPSVVVSADDRVLFSHGELAPYLRVPDQPRFELRAMIREPLKARLSATMHRCRQEDQPASTLCGRPGEGAVRITARPAPAVGPGAMLVSFEVADEAPADPPHPSLEEQELIEQLEGELDSVREQLHGAIDELEASNEELRASNEESMSMNEELQASNEELEATSEELRSVNSELSAVNLRLRDKLSELRVANDDLANFVTSTKLATVFLDEELRLGRFTAAAAELLGLGDGDRGRPATEVLRGPLATDLEPRARAVLSDFGAATDELRSQQGRWFSRTVLPYRTEARRVDGVVVTWTDVTELREATERLRVRERQQAVVAQLGLRALETDELRGFQQEAVDEVARTLGADLAELLELQPESGGRLRLEAGTGFRDGRVGREILEPALTSLPGYVLSAGARVVVDDYDAERRFSRSERLTDEGVRSSVACVVREGAHLLGVLAAHFRSPREYTEDDANFLQAVANVLANASLRQKAVRRMAIERGIARALAEARDLKAAAPEIARVIATELGAEVGELWTPNATGEVLTRAALYVEPRSWREEVERLLSSPQLGRGEGLPGRVWRDGRADWLGAVDNPHQLVRAREAEALGLRCGFAFPVVADRVVAIFSFLSSRLVVRDEVLLTGLQGLGETIGAFVLRRSVEEDLARLAAIVESSNDAILSKDLEGVIRTWNRGAEALYGYRPEEVIGRPVSVLVPDELRDELDVIMSKLRAGERIEQLETRRVRKDGRRVEVSLTVSPLRDSREQIVGASVMARDVGARREAERQLRQSEQRLYRALRAVPFPLIIQDEEGDLVLVSDRCRDLTGYSDEQLRESRAWAPEIVGGSAKERRRRFDQLFELGGHQHEGIHTVSTSHGLTREWDFFSAPLGTNADGRRLAITVAHDVTEERHYQQDIERSRRQLQRVTEATPDIISVVDLVQGRSVYANQELTKALGYTPEEVAAMDPAASEGLNHPDDAPAVRAFFAGIHGARTDEVRSLTYRVRHRDGGYRWLHVRAVPFEREGEVVRQVLTVAHDVTELRTQERALRVSQVRLQLALEAAAALVYTLELAGDLETAAIAELSGAEHVVGESVTAPLSRRWWVDRIHPEDAPGVDEATRAALASGEDKWHLRYRVRHASGGYVHAEDHVLIVRAEDGTPVRCAGVIMDVTRRHEFESRLEEQDRLKDEFLAMLGHELRNPLAAIRSAADLAEFLEIGDPALQRMIGVVDRQSEHMARLVDGLLDVSRVARGKVTLEREVVSLDEVVDHVLEDFAADLRRAELTLERGRGDGSIEVDADPTRLRQIVGNLLSNAIKFTPPGGTVAVRTEATDEEAILQVTDTGIGIDPRVSAHMFEPFRQGPQQIDRAAGGLGLGLSLVKGLTELHGGRVEARSGGKDQGARFTVHLPRVRSPSQPLPEGFEAEPSTERLLIVEDNLDAADMLRVALEMAGQRVEVAHDGPAALEMARAFRPGLILCDIGLPGDMSGYDVARALRQEPSLRGAYLVALTGYGREEDRDRAQEAGFDLHLTKPVGLDAIRTVIAKARERIH